MQKFFQLFLVHLLKHSKVSEYLSQMGINKKLCNYIFAIFAILRSSDDNADLQLVRGTEKLRMYHTCLVAFGLCRSMQLVDVDLMMKSNRKNSEHILLSLVAFVVKKNGMLSKGQVCFLLHQSFHHALSI